MKPLFPLFLVLLLTLFTYSAAAQTQKTAPVPKQDQCKISGMVVKLAGSEPLKKARVRLQSAEDRTHSVSVVTDSGGRFELKGIDPGRYQLSVSRIGFVTQEYGQKKPDDAGAMLTLRPGQEMKDLVFRLIPSAVIAGRILDDDGEPLPDVMVSAVHQVYLEGKRSLSTETSVQTNDLGEYRLFGLSPGRYFISAVFPGWSRYSRGEDSDDSPKSDQGYAKMYYPGTPDAAKASSISIKGGEEIPSVDILMRQVLVYRIRGHVYNLITHKPGRNANVFLLPKAKGFEWGGGNQSLVQKPDGSFEIPDVLPGSYILTAMWFDEGKIHTARLPIEVGNADVEGVSLTIAGGVDINGRIIWDGPPSLEQDELMVMPQPVDMTVTFGGQARVISANSFVLKDVSDGTYRANVWGQSKDCYIKAVQYAGSSALEDGFTVSRGSSGTLEITLSSHGARVQGAVTDADGLPVPGVRVVLVPDSTHRTRYDLFKTQTTDQYGHYEVRGIAPGDYKLFSWDEVENGAWEDPEFLKPFEEKGETISVQEGDQKTVNLTAIRTKSPDSAKP